MKPSPKSIRRKIGQRCPLCGGRQSGRDLRSSEPRGLASLAGPVRRKWRSTRGHVQLQPLAYMVVHFARIEIRAEHGADERTADTTDDPADDRTDDGADRTDQGADQRAGNDAAAHTGQAAAHNRSSRIERRFRSHGGRGLLPNLTEVSAATHCGTCRRIGRLDVADPVTQTERMSQLMHKDDRLSLEGECMPEYRHAAADEPAPAKASRFAKAAGGVFQVVDEQRIAEYPARQGAPFRPELAVIVTEVLEVGGSQHFLIWQQAVVVVAEPSVVEARS